LVSPGAVTDGVTLSANIAFRMPYSKRYLFNAIPDTNHNANLTNPNNPPNPRNRCEYGTLNSMFAALSFSWKKTDDLFAH